MAWSFLKTRDEGMVESTDGAKSRGRVISPPTLSMPLLYPCLYRGGSRNLRTGGRCPGAV